MTDRRASKKTYLEKCWTNRSMQRPSVNKYFAALILPAKLAILLLSLSDATKQHCSNELLAEKNSTYKKANTAKASAFR